ncbi:hypothetical protein MN086_06445 [Sulfurovum sp. XGS-02]|uniref:hypothetical protein n=1 Tax=Sulfurovum sp. XGS-02 TaxID=2925411 RepID=UPI002058CE3A|nr:hypothetical protein [Sulfurovum sp. XGS-02]UPT76692.1 hypothetical protein MN086_06445 [Sulfurovum sp. XGS-02]
MIFDVINEKLDEILKIHQSLPSWIPLSKNFAEECGYTTIDGLRKWCFNNLPPEKFEKRGKNWFIHLSVLHQIKRKSV